MYQNLLGILPVKPGYDEVVLQPKPLGGLNYVKGYHICRHGKISSAWKIENGHFLYDCSIPQGCLVRVELPNGVNHEMNKPGEYHFDVSI